MGFTYTGKDKLASVAARLYKARVRTCALSPLILMSDPQRLPDICAAAKTLPRGSALIYRHFGAKDKQEVAADLRQICFARDIQLLIGQDEELARACGADGLHLPERDLGRAVYLRGRYPDWLLTGAAHSAAALAQTNALDAAVLSPVFESQSPSAGAPLGIGTFAKMVRGAPVPVFALGGIQAGNVQEILGTGAAGIAGVSGFGGSDD